MIIFSIITVLITFIIWKSTNVYGTKLDDWGDWIPDYSKGIPLEFTWLHLIGLILLFIPWFNIIWFIILIVWYIKRSAENERGTDENDIFYSLNNKNGYINIIYNILNKKIW